MIYKVSTDEVDTRRYKLLREVEVTRKAFQISHDLNCLSHMITK